MPCVRFPIDTNRCVIIMVSAARFDRHFRNFVFASLKEAFPTTRTGRPLPPK